MIAPEEPALFAIVERGGEVLLSGEIDLAAKAELRSVLDAVLVRDGRLVVDLTAVSFIDSSGIEALCMARRRAERSGATVVLRSPTAIVMRALEVTGVAPLFHIDGSAGDHPRFDQ